MQADEILKELMRSTGLSAAALARAANLDESVVSRALNGKTVPSFNKISQAARSLGYELTLSPVEEATLHLIGSSMQELVNTINRYSGSADQWTRISASMRNLLEFPDKQASDFAAVTNGMDANWSAFLAGLYDYQHWDKGKASERRLRLEKPWTPLRKMYRSMTEPAEEFARYNVIVPAGELSWK